MLPLPSIFALPPRPPTPALRAFVAESNESSSFSPLEGMISGDRQIFMILATGYQLPWLL